jgi:biopolymer transport protein ExbD
MAEVNTGDSGGGGGKHGGKVRAKKSSTRVDMTPMVDLAFLLLTFFMLTTTFSKPKTMEINMPIKDETIKDPPKIPGKQTLTLLLSEKNRIYYYFGADDPSQPPTVEVSNFGADGIHKLLLAKNEEINGTVSKIAALKVKFKAREIDEKEYKKQANEIKGSKKALIVLVKADDNSTYKNLIDILDEMNVCNIGRYAIVDITPSEKEMIKNVVVQN